MKIVGIVAEYNPFHNGHAYQIAEARRISGADAVVVAMSGNFTQRGDMAIMDKWERASLAISGGADLVVEIPAVSAVSDAGHYAQGAAKVLRELGCDAISMGSESGDAKLLSKVSQNLELITDNIISSYVKDGISYPSARAKAYREMFGDDEKIEEEIEILGNPNDILALEYIRYAKGAEIIPVARKGARYKDNYDEASEFQSASGIRAMIEDGTDISAYVPSDVATALGREAIAEAARDRYYDIARHAVMLSTSDDIDNTPSGGEGLGNRLKSSVRSACSLDDLISAVKSRRYTYSRIERMICQLVLGITREDQDIEDTYVRVLAANDKGREVLRGISDSETLVITNLGRNMEYMNEAVRRKLSIDIMASDVYNATCGKDLEDNSDFHKKPIIQ